MNGFCELFRYWFVLIGWSALKNAVPINELKDNLSNIVLSLGVAFFIVLAGSASIDPASLINPNISLLLITLIVTFILRFIGQLIYLPVKIYKEQGGFEKELLTVEPKREDTGTSWWLHLAITNDTADPIDNCYIELRSITKHSDPEFQISLPQMVDWSDYPRFQNLSNQRRLVSPGEQVLVHLASAEDEQIYFYLADSFPRTTFGDFHAIISIRGVYRRKRLDRQFELEFSYLSKDQLICDTSKIEVAITGK